MHIILYAVDINDAWTSIGDTWISNAVDLDT